MLLAYFLSWTCHGTWLPGDERGWVDSRHNAYGTPLLPPDADRKDLATELMSDDPRALDARARAVVRQAITDHCAFKRWSILAMNIRTSHVHIVVGAQATAMRPEVVMGQLKSWSTRRLREAGLRAPKQPVWTREGSTRYVFDEESLGDIIDYVLNRQGPALD